MKKQRGKKNTDLGMHLVENKTSILAGTGEK